MQIHRHGGPTPTSYYDFPGSYFWSPYYFLAAEEKFGQEVYAEAQRQRRLTLQNPKR